MKNVKSTKNANKATTAITATSNEGYGLGSSKDGWDGITSEGDGYESKHKPLTAWALEINGEIDTTDIYSTRAHARAVRNDFAEFYGDDAKASVRKVLIIPVRGR